MVSGILNSFKIGYIKGIDTARTVPPMARVKKKIVDISFFTLSISPEPKLRPIITPPPIESPEPIAISIFSICITKETVLTTFALREAAIKVSIN